eukprot:GFUD01107821.1.p1 GENE.GFUD01107821.1~~GFUD01107821.1.p1  ORF type:complete len:107 (-),score=26.24 GFUD01107821.1:792-1112(-)
MRLVRVSMSSELQLCLHHHLVHLGNHLHHELVELPHSRLGAHTVVEGLSSHHPLLVHPLRQDYQDHGWAVESGFRGGLAKAVEWWKELLELTIDGQVSLGRTWRLS